MVSADITPYRPALSNDISAPQPVVHHNTSTGPDGLDDLFNYDVGLDEVSRNAENALTAPLASDKGHQSGQMTTGDGLGIDEEIKVTKKRKPIAKLDESRLLSQAGIPKLRRISKERFKFKGKGHEYTDLARLLDVNQLWLDDLYPRAKFADGLAIIEKLGHTKRIQVMRRQWIDERKPKLLSEEQGAIPNVGREREMCPASGTLETPEQSTTALTGMAISRTPTRAESEDLYDATPGVKRVKAPAVPGDSANLFISDDEDLDQPEDDELDALLAEDAMTANTNSVQNGRYSLAESVLSNQKPPMEDNFDDEMEAMADMDEIW